MSLMLCKCCGFPVDTDEHPEAFYEENEDGKEIEHDFVLCESCKDDRAKDRERRETQRRRKSGDY
jgi:hypothetical protein